jgi:hypothetical protein
MNNDRIEVKLKMDFFENPTSNKFIVPTGEINSYGNEDFYIALNTTSNSIFIGNENTNNYLRLGNNTTFFGNEISIPYGLNITPNTMSIYELSNTSYIDGGVNRVRIKGDEISLAYNLNNDFNFSGSNECEISCSKNVKFNCRVGVGILTTSQKHMEIMSDMRIINSQRYASVLDIFTGSIGSTFCSTITTTSSIEPIMIQTQGGKVSMGLSGVPNKQLEILSDMRIINSNSSSSVLDIFTGSIGTTFCSTIKTTFDTEPLMLQTHGGKVSLGLNSLPQKQLEIFSDMRIINSNSISSVLDIFTGSIQSYKCATIKTGFDIEPLMLQTHGGRVSLGLNSLPQKQLEILSDMRIINSNSSSSVLDIFTGSIQSYKCASIKTASTIEPLMLQTHGGKVCIGSTVIPNKQLEILSDMRIVNSNSNSSVLDIFTGSIGSTSLATIQTTSNDEPLMFQTHGGRIGIGFNNRIPSDTLEIEGSLKVVGSVTNGSDDRIKTNERYITDATGTLLKLKPQIYTKNNVKEEAGLIAQEVFYDAPELRHLVALPVDADIEYITKHHINTSKFPEKDPDYAGWGETLAGVNYIELIPYLIKYVQENNAQIDVLTNKINVLEKYINVNK